MTYDSAWLILWLFKANKDGQQLVLVMQFRASFKRARLESCSRYPGNLTEAPPMNLTVWGIPRNMVRKQTKMIATHTQNRHALHHNQSICCTALS